MHVRLLVSQNTEGINMCLSGNFKRSVELNRNILCVYGLSKGCNLGIAEYFNLDCSGNDKGDDQDIFSQYCYYNYCCFYCYHKYYYYYHYYLFSATTIFLGPLIVWRWSFRGIMGGMFCWPKGKMHLLLLLLLMLLLLLLIIIIDYYCYYCSFYYHYYYNTSTIKATCLRVKIWHNIEGEFEQNQNILRACRFSKGCITRIDLGIKF